jgi:hypothetical protein
VCPSFRGRAPVGERRAVAVFTVTVTVTDHVDAGAVPVLLLETFDTLNEKLGNSKKKCETRFRDPGARTLAAAAFEVAKAYLGPEGACLRSRPDCAWIRAPHAHRSHNTHAESRPDLDRCARVDVMARSATPVSFLSQQRTRYTGTPDHSRGC